jgi:large subunit ribosomal protein L1
LSVGRANFDDNKIIENYKSVLEVVEKEKPSGIKGNFINSIFLTSSMGPSTKISLASD